MGDDIKTIQHRSCFVGHPVEEMMQYKELLQNFVIKYNNSKQGINLHLM